MELYLNEALEQYYEDKNLDILLHCLKPAIESQGTIKAFAEKAHIKREHLYKLFKREVKQPEFATLSNIFNNLGLEIHVKQKKHKRLQPC